MFESAGQTGIKGIKDSFDERAKDFNMIFEQSAGTFNGHVGVVASAVTTLVAFGLSYVLTLSFDEDNVSLARRVAALTGAATFLYALFRTAINVCIAWALHCMFKGIEMIRGIFAEVCDPFEACYASFAA